MQIELSTILTVISVAAAVYFASKSNGRQQDEDVSRRASETAMLVQKLDNISEDTRDIKKEMSDVKHTVSNLSERVVIVEQSTKSAHHRIDGIDPEGFGKRKRFRFFGR